MAGETGNDPVTFRVRAGRATNYATRQLNLFLGRGRRVHWIEHFRPLGIIAGALEALLLELIPVYFHLAAPLVQ